MKTLKRQKWKIYLRGCYETRMIKGLLHQSLLLFQPLLLHHLQPKKKKNANFKLKKKLKKDNKIERVIRVLIEIKKNQRKKIGKKKKEEKKTPQRRGKSTAKQKIEMKERDGVYVPHLV